MKIWRSTKALSSSGARSCGPWWRMCAARWASARMSPLRSSRLPRRKWSITVPPRKSIFSISTRRPSSLRNSILHITTRSTPLRTHSPRSKTRRVWSGSSDSSRRESAPIVTEQGFLTQPARQNFAESGWMRLHRWRFRLWSHGSRACLKPFLNPCVPWRLTSANLSLILLCAWWIWDSVICLWTAQRRHFLQESGSACSWRERSGTEQPGCSMFSTSRRLACTLIT